MRDIKFRVWDSSLKRMDYPCAIFLEGGKWINAVELYHCQGVHACGVELMQYTGFKDKYSMEIFEGDIVLTAEDGNCVVEFQYGIFGVQVIREYAVPEGAPEGREEFIPISNWDAFHGFKQNDLNLEWCLEIIGNIYENPELLNGN